MVMGAAAAAPLLTLLALLVRLAAGGSNLPLLSATLRTFQVHACDGHELVVECWPRTVVSIYFAQYGRQVHQLCDNDTRRQDAPDCLSGNALQAVEESCREQRVCRLLASPQAFGGDPCPGLTKYAEVAYKCRPSEFSNKVVCEGGQLRLQCPSQLRIAVYSASFGATHRGVPECPQPLGEGLLEDCGASFATEAVMSRCHARRRCQLAADTGTFGRPGCPAQARLFLKVVHACVSKSIFKELRLGGPDEDYEAFVEEPRDREEQTTVKTDMQSDENNSGEEGVARAPEHTATGFLSDWLAAFNFLKENREKSVLYLSLSLSAALLLALAALAARFYARRRRGRRAPPAKPEPPFPVGGISPFGDDCLELEHLEPRSGSFRRAMHEGHPVKDKSFYS